MYDKFGNILCIAMMSVASIWLIFLLIVAAVRIVVGQ